MPSQKQMDAAMRSIGRLHERLNRVPWVGEPIARGFSRFMAMFPMLSGSMHKTTSIEETRDMMRGSGEEMGFPFEFSEVEQDRFVLELPYCPYGFTRADQQRPCDTAMDMDRAMLRLCGAELTVEETIPAGASRCKMTVRQVRTADGRQR
jgi:hypothetical protein